MTYFVINKFLSSDQVLIEGIHQVRYARNEQNGPSPPYYSKLELNKARHADVLDG